jgi:hypothetical protein
MSGTEPLRSALEVKMQKVTPADVAEGLTEFPDTTGSGRDARRTGSAPVAELGRWWS